MTREKSTILFAFKGKKSNSYLLIVDKIKKLSAMS